MFDINGNGTTATLPAPAPATPETTLASEYDIQDVPAGPVQMPTVVKPTPAVPAQIPATPPVVIPTAPAPAQPATPAAPSPRHPDWLTKKCEAAGVHPAVIAKFSSEELSNFLTDQLFSMVAARDQASRSQTIQNPGANPNAVPPESRQPLPPPQPQLPSIDWGEIEEQIDQNGTPITVRRKVKEDEIYTPLVNIIKQQQQQINELKEFVQTMGSQVQANQKRSKEQRFDDAFSRWPHIFGKGGIAEVKPEERNRRKAVHALCMGIPAAQQQQMTIEQAVEAMAAEVYGQKTLGLQPAPAPAAPPSQTFVGDEGNAWNQGVVARPTQRQPQALPPGRERAIQAANAWAAEQRQQGAISGTETTTSEFLD